MALKKMRNEIDRIDAELLQLLMKRMEAAVRTTRFKAAIDDEARENVVLERAKRRSWGLCQEDFGTKLFQLIVEESKRVQSKDLTLVGFSGEHGAFSEVAIMQHEPSWKGIPCGELSDVFEAVSSGAVDYGIVPIENSVEGSVNEAEELLLRSDLFIAAEVKMEISHCMLTLKETDYRDIREVYATPRMLSACRGFIKRHKLLARPYHDSAAAAAMLLRDRPRSTGVIASKKCAELYELEVLSEGIQDVESNETRYLILSKTPPSKEGEKTTIHFETPNQAGALLEFLNFFSGEGINLLRIESRPSRERPGNMGFLLDFCGCSSEKKVQECLNLIQKNAPFYRFLGSYKESRLAS